MTPPGSSQCPEVVATPIHVAQQRTGATVLELEPVVDGSRLHYQLLDGSGPKTGWVTVQERSGWFWMVGGCWPMLAVLSWLMLVDVR